MRLSKLAALVCGTAVAATVALWPGDAAAQAGSATAIREATNTFLAALTPVQRAEARDAFSTMANDSTGMSHPGPAWVLCSGI